MNKKKTIRKGLVIGACLLAGGGITTLLIAANRKEATHYCQQIDVRVKGSGEKFYITKRDILAQLNSASKTGILNKSIETIDMAMLEKTLEKQQWIKDAELYFDTRDVLHVIVSERTPVARVFTTANTSFYMDSAGQRMPLLPDVSVRVPVVTSFTAAKALGKQDSAVAKEVAAIAQYISSQPFWNAQIAQIDITPAGTFELLPVVGNHVIRIGHADDLEQKLSNLLLFYKQVLRKTGFDKYAVVDVQYKDQVIGSHERTTSLIDSVQLQRNIQELMRKTKLQAEADSIAAVELMAVAKDSAARQDASEPPPVTVATAIQPMQKPTSNLVKTNTANIRKKQAIQKPKPKALLKKK